ncbi:hypothetical protein RDI58_013618 [Solanum bulbocastanum]|uniref:Uncharacterized protein n=1 Tax=Solanum bulbocastanum TaxID=147425 RepID=A0AAN8TS42_SOLBU
MLNEPTKK